MARVKLLIDISERLYNTIMDDQMPSWEDMSLLCTNIYKGQVVEYITDEQEAAQSKGEQK